MDLLDRGFLAKQGNINKCAIYRTGASVNTQMLKMTSNRNLVQIHKKIHRIAVFFEAWAGCQQLPVSPFPSSVYSDSSESLLTHRQ